MNTALKHLVTVTKAPTSKGTFEGEIDYNPPNGDTDKERIESWTNIPGEFVLGYQHAYGDPGSMIGDVTVHPKGDGRHLIVSGRLDLANPMARAVHERMLLPSTDSMALKELSVGFDYDRRSIEFDTKGVTVIKDATLKEVSIVHKGAQPTSISNVKDADGKESTATRTLRNHLDSSHAQPVRAFKPPLADLILRHRILHANTGPVEETHLRTGLPYGDTVPVRTTNTRSAKNSAVSNEGARRAARFIAAAREAAKHDAQVAAANDVISKKLEADAMLSMTLEDHYAAEAARDNWAAEKERMVMEQRDRERAEEAAMLDAATQTVEDFTAAQRRKDAEAVRDLLAQDGPTFTMQLGPNGELRDP